MYKIRDLQFEDEERYFADGETFKTKEEIREQLVSYHSQDCNKASLKRMSIDEILEFGEWELEEVKK